MEFLAQKCTLKNQPMLQILAYPLLIKSPRTVSELGNKSQNLGRDLVQQGSGTGLSELVALPRHFCAAFTGESIAWPHLLCKKRDGKCGPRPAGILAHRVASLETKDFMSPKLLSYPNTEKSVFQPLEKLIGKILVRLKNSGLYLRQV